jgi:hypothetical protein
VKAVGKESLTRCKIYNATSSPVRFESKNIVFFFVKSSLQYMTLKL